MATRLLTHEQYLRSFAAPMQRLNDDESALCDIEPYLAEIPIEDLGLALIGDVVLVAKDGLERVHHVVLNTDRKNVQIVLVIGVKERAVLGHALLDLGKEYGLV
jgi:hypothetical protein